MAIVSLDEAKAYLRLPIEDTDEDAYLNMIIQAAEDSIQKTTGRTFGTGDARAKIVCLMMISDLYENRMMSSSDNERIRQAVQHLLIQLQYEVEEVVP